MIPDEVTTHSIAEAIELHLALLEEKTGVKIKLSDLARRTLIKGLTNQDITMKERNYGEEEIKDSLTAAIYSFISGYLMGKKEERKRQ